MDKTQNDASKAPAAGEEKDIGMNEPLEMPSENQTDSEFDGEPGSFERVKTAASEDSRHEEGSDEGESQEEENVSEEAQDTTQTESCVTSLNDLSCEDIKRDIKRNRDIRDLMSRVINSDGCVFKSDYTLKRFCQSVIWYSKKARQTKFFFFLFSSLTVILPTVATLLNSISGDSNYFKIAVTSISAATAILTSLLTLFKFQHKWIQFRSTAEELQTELSLFISESGAYSDESLKKQNKDSKNPNSEFSEEKLTELRECQFLIGIEKIMAKEKSQWENLHKPSK